MSRRPYILSVLIVFSSFFAAILVLTVPTPYTPVFEPIRHRPCPAVLPAPNAATAANITRLRMPVDTLPKNWISRNEITMQALFRCLETSNCGQNQTKIVLLGYGAFLNEVEESHEGGEVIWARSTVRALENLGYTFIYTPNNERSLQLYHVFRGLIKALFIEEQETNACFKDPNCILSPHNPSGIPVWKMFSFNWWTGPVGPLANNWTLNPEDYRLEGKGYAPNNYLGYSVEPGCSARPFISHAARKRQAYVLAKEMHYFSPEIRAWDPEFYESAHKVANVDFVSGVRGEPTADFPPRLKNIGYMSPNAFYDQLSRSLVLVGVGFPLTSPTPYDALCYGVPFINPVMEWDAAEPENRDKWSVQHGMIKHLNPPYVYHVFKGDHDGFVKAVKDAVSHPIESYVLERMKMHSIEQRLRRILETDWEEKALEFSLGSSSK